MLLLTIHLLQVMFISYTYFICNKSMKGREKRTMFSFVIMWCVHFIHLSLNKAHEFISYLIICLSFPRYEDRKEYKWTVSLSLGNDEWWLNNNRTWISERMWGNGSEELWRETTSHIFSPNFISSNNNLSFLCYL